jgi:4-amino-4-deoxychorismate lyase
MAHPVQTLVNGKISNKLSILDRGLHYGDGVFETIAVKDGKPQYLHDHLDRLMCGCRRLRIAAPQLHLLKADIETLCESSSVRTLLKIIVTRGQGGRGYRPNGAIQPTRIVTRYAWPTYSADYQTEGIAATVCTTRLSRNVKLAGIKHLNRLEQVLARGEWCDEYQEGLMLDTDGYILEGTMSNVFTVQGDTLLTPDLSQAGIAGIMRQKIMQCAARLSIPIAVCKKNLRDLENADGVFFCNSIIGIWPVRTLIDKPFARPRIIDVLMAELGLRK